MWYLICIIFYGLFMSFNWNIDWNDRNEIVIDVMKFMVFYYIDNWFFVNL